MNPNDVKSEFKKIITKINLSTTKEFSNVSKKEFPKSKDHLEGWQSKWDISLKKAKEISIFTSNYLFISITPSNYSSTKKKIKNKFKDSRTLPKKTK